MLELFTVQFHSPKHVHVKNTGRLIHVKTTNIIDYPRPSYSQEYNIRSSEYAAVLNCAQAPKSIRQKHSATHG